MNYVTIGFNIFLHKPKLTGLLIQFILINTNSRILYRKDCVCHHALRHKRLTIEQTIDKNRIRNCSASTKILIKNEAPDTLRKDEFIKKRLNTEIKVIFLIQISSFSNS